MIKEAGQAEWINLAAKSMISLTRLNGDSFTLNAFLIEQIQSFPDTTITLTNGKKMVVRNTEAEVIERAVRFFQQVGIHVPIQEAGEDDE